MPNPNRSTSTSTPTQEPIATTALLECAISARWFELSSLCDQYLPPDDDNISNEDEPNPLFATILHTAILTASNHHTISIFGNTLPPSPSNDVPSEYCPYLTPFSIEDAETTKYRRICIGKLCRLDPSWISQKVCRTTVLHLAVRMRNPSLIDLLLRYNPNAAREVDDLGYVALHYAVYPPDESMLYQKAMSMQNARTNIANNSLISPSDMPNAANMDVGGGTAGGVSFGVRTVERARGMLAGWTEMAMLSRHRVVSMSGECIASKKGKKRIASAGDVAEGHRRSMRLRTNPTMQQQKTVQYLLFNNVFSSPSTLVRAMLFLKNVEDTSIPFIEAEKQSKSNTTFGEYPTNIHPELWKRMSRPWKSEGQRVSVVRRLIGVYAEGMEIQCQQDGDTPLIIAARTFQGGGEEDGEDEDLNDVWLMGGGIDAVVQPPAVAENNDNNNGEDAEMDSQTQNEVPGEEEADYEADLRGWVMKRDDLGEKPAAIQGRAEVNAVQENATQQQHENDPPIENNPEDLEVIRIMISAARNTNSSNDPFLISNLDGDTPLHAATRIGAARRLVTLLIAAQPLAAGRRAKDGNTPLHLMLRRCSHLAPEGVGGLASYDVEMVQLMVDVAGEGVMGFRNGDGRTPIHEAAYYGGEILALVH
jgi:ankyrin repeat protein